VGHPAFAFCVFSCEDPMISDRFSWLHIHSAFGAGRAGVTANLTQPTSRDFEAVGAAMLSVKSYFTERGPWSRLRFPQG
jgi:hypothetical protein